MLEASCNTQSLKKKKILEYLNQALSNQGDYAEWEKRI